MGTSPKGVDPRALGRSAASRCALEVRPWEWATGPVTAAGKRRISGNSRKHGLASVAHGLAVTYAEAVLAALAPESVGNVMGVVVGRSADKGIRR